MENKGFWRKLFRKEKNTEINNKGPNQTWMNSEKCENGHWYDNSVYGSCPYCVQDHELNERRVDTARNRTGFLGDDDSEKDTFNKPSQNNQARYRTECVSYYPSSYNFAVRHRHGNSLGLSQSESNENAADTHDYKKIDGADFVEIDYFPIGTSWRHFPFQREKVDLFDVIEKDGSFFFPTNMKEMNIHIGGDSLSENAEIRIKIDSNYEDWNVIKLRKNWKNKESDEYFFDDSDKDRCSLPIDTIWFLSRLRLETGHYALFNSRTRKAALIAFTYEEKSNIRTCPHCGGSMTVIHYSYEDQEKIFHGFGSILLPGWERDEYRCMNCGFSGYAEYSHEDNDNSNIRNEMEY